jgi:hypothetical protein
LLLAFIDIPDFPGWLGRIANAVERMAGAKPGDSAAQATPREAIAEARLPDAAVPSPPLAGSSDSRSRSARQKEPTHA